ncbi:MAG: hypothetical protein ACYDCS_08770 [Candidatus Dormibacteria bacterium]
MRDTDLTALDERANASAAEVSADGDVVRYLGSLLMRDDEVVLCRFEGSELAVRRVAERASIPFDRILEVGHSPTRGEATPETRHSGNNDAPPKPEDSQLKRVSSSQMRPRRLAMNRGHASCTACSRGSAAPLRRETMGSRQRVAVAAGATLALALALAGCSVTPATTPTPTAASGGTATNTPTSNGSAGQGTQFTVQVNFMGADTVQGSFTTGTVDGLACAQYSSDAFPWSVGLGPPHGSPIQVGGTTVNFLLTVPQSTFHGAGTYTGNVVQGLSVGADGFTGIDSTMTLNGDGSGNASFTNLTGGASGTTESGTVTWTCG